MCQRRIPKPIRKVIDMDLPELMIARYERNFGKGSWAELEAGVRARHPDVFEMLAAFPDQDNDVPRKWWQFWC